MVFWMLPENYIENYMELSRESLVEHTIGMSVIDKINAAILYISSCGGTKWTGIVPTKTSFVKDYYRKLGYTITVDSVSPLLLTISWTTR